LLDNSGVITQEEDEDDDVLPGTPEDEQPANAGHGHSIINMGGMDFDR
jgi:hypothetical protein